MAHIDIIGTQHYRQGIGHPSSDVNNCAPVEAVTDPVTGGISLSSVDSNTNYSSLKNFNPVNYPYTRRALSNLRANGTRFAIWSLGDSTTVGGYAGGTTNAVAGSWPRYLSEFLSNAGLQSGWQNFMGDHATYGTTSLQAVDQRVTLGAGWTAFTGVGFCIGGYPQSNTSNTNPITFAPTIQTDTLEVYYLDGSGTYDDFTILSGAAGATVPTTGGSVTVAKTNTIKKAVATYTLGTNIWNVAKANVNSNNLLIMGMVAYNSAVPEIQLLNCGCFSQKISFLTDETYYFNPFSAIKQATNATNGNPLAIINLGINDWINSTTPTAFYATLTSVVTQYKSHGTEVLLVVPVPTNPASSAPSTLSAQAAIVQKIYLVAYATNCAVIDLTNRWVDYTTANTFGYYGDTITHPSKFGYADIAMAVKQFFNAL